MCGIAGIIYKNGNGAHRIGRDITAMLQSMKHRGPDSTGYALYSAPGQDLRLRVKLADSTEPRRHRFRRRRRAAAGVMSSAILPAAGARIRSDRGLNEYTFGATVEYHGELKKLADHVESVDHAEVLSLGHSLEIVKDLGDARTVAGAYSLEDYFGSHGIGHVRMATESDVDIANAHPYWAYPFSDVAVVHNGQLTNYHQWRRRLEASGHRFASACDSEIIAVYLADRMAGRRFAGGRDASEPRGPRRRLHLHLRLRGRARRGQGRARRQAARPLRGRRHGRARLRGDGDPAVIDHEIETYDPYESTVMVWTR